MIRHCVMLSLSADIDPRELDAVMQGLSDLVARLPGLAGFCAGPNRDFEGKSVGYNYGFTFDAVDRAALEAYAQHPEHVVLGGQLVALCRGGGSGISVYDLEHSL